eukprot:CAMPEP_0185789478 /NCGR_PEP_ID=MMETSP1174-20130828/151274_1 /TAXON_ID=35687 /ORGANISM="Dictyocha speculum, Strain CCMP1381" /LENGTH=35 /DNA_ID= /DNA_START= /DNA_END= /DNA_ORIENTATION=
MADTVDIPNRRGCAHYFFMLHVGDLKKAILGTREL